LLTTFHACGRYPIDRSTATGYVIELETADTSRYSMAVTARSVNWSSGTVRSTGQDVGHGSVFGASRFGISTLSFVYCTCLDNQGQTAFYYTSGNIAEARRPRFLFECVNFVKNVWLDRKSYLLYLQNAAITVTGCTFFDNDYTGLFYLAASSIDITGCVWDSKSPVGLAVAAIYPGNTQSLTATYDPGVPISVCVVAPGTTAFSHTRPFGGTASLDSSVGWSPTIELAESVAGLASREIGPSEKLADSGPLELTAGFSGSEGASESSNLKASGDFDGSGAAGETRGFEDTQKCDGSDGLKETQRIEASQPYTGSREFSASSSFTEGRDRYRGGRSLIKLSGYLFFFFLYGNPQ
jgi:hypothetical protein